MYYTFMYVPVTNYIHVCTHTHTHTHGVPTGYKYKEIKK